MVWCKGTVTKQCTNTSYTLYAPRQATHACYKQADKLHTVTRQVTKTSYMIYVPSPATHSKKANYEGKLRRQATYMYCHKAGYQHKLTSYTLQEGKL